MPPHPPRQALVCPCLSGQQAPSASSASLCLVLGSSLLLCGSGDSTELPDLLHHDLMHCLGFSTQLLQLISPSHFCPFVVPLAVAFLHPWRFLSSLKINGFLSLYRATLFTSFSSSSPSLSFPNFLSYPHASLRSPSVCLSLPPSFWPLSSRTRFGADCLFIAPVVLSP